MKILKNIKSVLSFKCIKVEELTDFLKLHKQENWQGTEKQEGEGKSTESLKINNRKREKEGKGTKGVIFLQDVKEMPLVIDWKEYFPKSFFNLLER